MSEQPIPEEWKRAATEAAKCLSVARAIESKQYPDGAAPGVLAGLAIAVSLARLSDSLADISDRLVRIEQETRSIVCVLGD